MTMGLVDWPIPSGSQDDERRIRRVVVSKDGDVLVLDPVHPPRAYAEGGWRDNSREDDDGNHSGWLSWTLRPAADRQEPVVNLCHIFPERPIYRPDEPVHLKGYVRRYKAGTFEISHKPGTLVVKGPDGGEWRWPLEINEYGSFYKKFDEKTLATGDYKAFIVYSSDAATDGEAENGDTGHETIRDGYAHCHVAKFKKEAYRLPKFEVSLHAPASIGLDTPFSVGLSAEYYAGGQVAGRPLRWRVTQIPFTWIPKERPGYQFSADQRFSGNQPFRSTPVLERDEKTDEHGGAQLALDPTIEPTAQPRKYRVEATVTGDDDQTVTNTQEILALPPFVLGLKVPRYLEHGDKIEPSILVEDGQGHAISGQPVTVRLLRRQWNSILQAGDFTQGQAKYVTEAIEDKVAEIALTSGEQPLTPSFPIQGAGVFVVEVESADKLGRLQTVKMDLFAGGDRPATWSRPPAEVFSVAPDKTAYAPGDTATLILQSPFQTARALAIVEEPGGHNSYSWIDVKNGYASFPLTVRPEYLPQVAVHFVLMRGRLPGDNDEVSSHADLRKPATLAATQWVTVTPVKNIVKVALTYPHKAIPGETIDLTVKLSDDQDNPLSGEVTLWMVDQAVLALAREATLDPLPQFIVPRSSKMTLRDSRNMAFGLLPLQEEPGGDEGDEGSPLLRVTVRKNFTPVPYYEPSLRVGEDGTAAVKITLPDSLTNFKIRAKAVSGAARFGFGTGEIQVRQPVIVQPAFPRYVRPGDAFDLSAAGRVVDGDGGAGKASLTVDGLTLQRPPQQDFSWPDDKVQHFSFPVGVPAAAQGSVAVTMAVERTADHMRDAFQVSLPVLPDRDPVVERQSLALSPGQSAGISAVTEPVRPGSLSREILIASPELAALANGLDYLRRYPFGCTEQRISQTRADIAGLRFASIAGDSRDHVEASLRATEEWIASVLTTDGLVPYWPGAHGYVSLTAWSLQLLTEAKTAGLPVDTALRDNLVKALKQSLRSDYPHFIPGETWAERSWALAALTAAGQGDAAYAAELLRKTANLRLEDLALAAWSLSRSSGVPAATLSELRQKLWNGIVWKLDEGHETYGGLQERSPQTVILPSEARTMAIVLRAALALAPTDPKTRLLADALMRLGAADGWGSTNANAEAMLALADDLAARKPSAEATHPLTVSFGGDHQTLALSGTLPAARMAIPAAAGTVTGAETPMSVVVKTRYLPQTNGSAQASRAHGFAVDRETLVFDGNGQINRRYALDQPATAINLSAGEVIEDHVVVVNPVDRTHVAVILPLAAGLEPLNPRLATAPPDAEPSAPPTLEPSYTAALDDKMAYYYDELPKGTYDFRFRSRATVSGRFIEPPASAHAMYDDTVSGSGNGAIVTITRSVP